ncbi:MAG: hypothetical protein ACO1N5_10010 [Noviherbaspirillum sp.]
MKSWISGFLGGCLALWAALAVFPQAGERLMAHVAPPELSELERKASRLEKELLGYTRYTDYLYAGQKALQGETRFLAAKVERQEGFTRVIQRKVMGLSSEATVAVWYVAEYSFGYDLKPGSYAIRQTPSGIEISIGRPTLLASPATRSLRHKVLSGGILTDEAAATLKLYEGIAESAHRKGVAMASDEAIVALCEKKLIAFVQDFLARQPGVNRVPAITVSYREAAD